MTLMTWKGNAMQPIHLCSFSLTLQVDTCKWVLTGISSIFLRIYQYWAIHLLRDMSQQTLVNVKLAVPYLIFLNQQDWRLHDKWLSHQFCYRKFNGRQKIFSITWQCFPILISHILLPIGQSRSHDVKYFGLRPGFLTSICSFYCNDQINRWNSSNWKCTTLYQYNMF